MLCTFGECWSPAPPFFHRHNQAESIQNLTFQLLTTSWAIKCCCDLPHALVLGCCERVRMRAWWCWPIHLDNWSAHQRRIHLKGASKPICPMITDVTFCAVSCRLSYSPTHLRARMRPCTPLPSLSRSMQVSSKDMCKCAIPGCSLESYVVGVGVADAALLLCVVPPKSHGVDDRSPGETRRSAQKLERVDGKTW